MIITSKKKHWLCQQSDLIPEKQTIITADKSISYNEFYAECLRMCDYLNKFGINEKDHVGILFGHSYKFFVIVNALWLICAIPVPLNTRNTTKEIQNQLNQADINFLIIDDISNSQFSILNFQNTIFLSKDSKDQAQSAKFNPQHSKFNILNSALIMFTSGSSGKPKAVVHNFKSLFESVKNLNSIANLSSSDLWLASLPLYHIGGFMILIRALLSGGSITFPKSLKHVDILRCIRKDNPTHISFVSTTLARILEDEFVPPKNLKYAFLGGGPVSSELCKQATNNNWPIVKVYGSTETCSMVAALFPNEANKKPDSVGKVLGTNKIRIKYMSKIKSMSTYDTVDLYSSGEVGEIDVSSQSLFTEYYNNKVTTDNVLKNGWYNTGDYGWLDEEGYLYISSRREDLIITGGENVNVHDVETVIKTISGIEDAYLFALKDDVWGQIVCAAIVSKVKTELEITNFLKDKIGGYKIPKQFFFVENIPRNEMGKVNRSKLMSMINLS